ncbi:MAG TPA: outer membrane beta-barrel protein [Puia sp.]|jgi:hypothetical protein|nr:outer membrane beta-barrel protein [Puia sp.]
MEHVENDMDDLFQKAGELYPLKTSGSDWDTVAGKLNEEGFGDHITVLDKNARATRNKHRWLLLLLLIPIGLGSIVYFSISKKQPATSAITNVKNNNAKGNDALSVKPDIQTEQTKTELNNRKDAVKSSTQKESFDSRTRNQSVYASARNNRGKLAKLQLNGNIEVPLPAESRKYKNSIQSEIAGASLVADESLHANTSVTEISENNQNSLAQTLAIKPLSLSVSGKNENIAIEGKTFPSAASGPMNNVLPPANSKTNKTFSNKGFYVGLIAGPDLSTVKFQSVKQPGFSLGVLAGYRISKRFSIETGLLWDKKYYYSNGDYFNKSHTNIPPNSKISSVTGNCNMFEIPINLRYDFATKNNYGFFVKAGLSSYLMKKENYSIIMEQWAAYPYDSTYKNASNNIFSVLQLSGGYEHTIGAKTNIWIEPYLKIPLQGIGIGNMPIMSAGFYIGISYSFR